MPPMDLRNLADKYLGPFKVIVKLPKSYGRIHPTFHVALLEPYPSREGVELPKAVEVAGEEEWEVKRILDARFTHKKRV